MDRRRRQRLGARGLTVRRPDARGPDREHPQPLRHLLHRRHAPGPHLHPHAVPQLQHDEHQHQRRLGVRRPQRAVQGRGRVRRRDPGSRRREPHAQRRGRQLRPERPELTGHHVGSCPGSRQRSASGWVNVTDGKLTVDAIGGTNTKLAWVTIDSVPVAGLTATVQSATSIALDWADVDGASGYKVWRSEALPAPNNAGDLVTISQLGTPTSSDFTDTTAEKGVLYHYSVGTSATAAAINGTVVQAMSDDARAPAADAAAEGQLPEQGGHHARHLRRRLRPRLQQHPRLRLDPPRHPGAAEHRRQRTHPDDRRHRHLLRSTR